MVIRVQMRPRQGMELPKHVSYINVIEDARQMEKYGSKMAGDVDVDWRK